VVTELLKVLYNTVLGLDEKIELITAAQELFLPHENVRSYTIDLMSNQDIVTHIIEPFV